MSSPSTPATPDRLERALETGEGRARLVEALARYLLEVEREEARIRALRREPR